MKKSFHFKTFVYAALLFWLFASASGMHEHYCFDGMEPPVTVHFDLVKDHHIDNEHLIHKDLDNKTTQVNLIKLTSFDLHFLAALFLIVFIWPLIRGQHYALSNTPLAWLTPTGLRPPLRAPPALNT